MFFKSQEKYKSSASQGVTCNRAPSEPHSEYLNLTWRVVVQSLRGGWGIRILALGARVQIAAWLRRVVVLRADFQSPQ